jgi:hypothetical protein
MGLTSEPLDSTMWNWEAPQNTFFIISIFEYFSLKEVNLVTKNYMYIG